MDRDEQVFPQKIDSFEKRPRGKSSNIFPVPGELLLWQVLSAM